MTRLVSTSCQGCRSNCAIRAEVDEGRVISVTGNPESATTHGMRCIGADMALAQTADPDRITTPLRRTNPQKGRGVDPGWEPVSWDEALGELADRMMELRRQGKSHHVAVQKGRSTGIADVIMKVLPDIYGTPNRFNHDGICGEPKCLSMGFLDGRYSYPDFDLTNAEFVLLWGTDPLSSNHRRGHSMSVWSRLTKRAHVAVVDPRRSPTAEKSSQWVPVFPGTDAALACAMAHVILSEDLWNADYVGTAPRRGFFAPGKAVSEREFSEHRTSGVCRWWNLALKDATPAWAAAICKVSEEEIARLARSFAAAGPKAVSWLSTGVAMTPRGAYTSMACHALNGLVGSVGEGGCVRRSPKMPTAKLPSTAPYQDSTAVEGCSRPHATRRGTLGVMAAKKGVPGNNMPTGELPETILSDDPYPIELLIAYWTNPAFSATQAQQWEQALEKLPFLVHITTNPSETSQYADMLLPASHHAFESWGFARSMQNLSSSVTLEQPCADAPGSCKNDEAQIPFLLAQKLADRGMPQLLDYLEHELADPITGQPATEGTVALNATKIMTRPLWGPDGVTQGAWDEFCRRGVWNSAELEGNGDEPLCAEGFQFASQRLSSALSAHAAACGVTVDQALEAAGYDARGGLALVPHYEEPWRSGDPAELPLVMTDFKSPYNLEGRSANLGLYQQLAGPDCLRLNPSDMSALGLRDGDEVRVVSATGSIVTQALSWDGVNPGVAGKCYGQGHWAYGHIAAADFERAVPRGGNNNELHPYRKEGFSSASARNGGLTRIRVERVG
ncbi:MAG: molybdopterin-dependent oxidoreductase [Coriobacteriales bacterium]